MNKDFELKQDPSYHMGELRKRIDDSIKRVRDDGAELDVPQAKVLPPIPVTSADGRPHKYFQNKSRREF